MNLPPCNTSGEATDKLTKAKAELSSIPPDAPIAGIAALMNDLSLRAAAGDETARSELKRLLVERDQLTLENESRTQARADVRARIAHYEREQARLLAEEKRATIEQCDKELEAEVARFITLSRDVCRSYDRILQLQRRNHRAGASTRLPDRLGSFDFQFFVPYGWNGTAAQMIAEGSLRWLNDEKQAAQELARAA